MALVISWRGLDGHTIQRIGQLSIGVILIFPRLSRKSPFSPIDRTTYIAAGLVFAAGTISISMAHQPLWAGVEIAVAAICFAIAEIISGIRRTGMTNLDRLLILFVVFICAFKSIDFAARALHFFVNGTGLLDTDSLLGGFSNKRFYGQFQTFTLPLLVLPLLLVTTKRSAQAWVFLLLSFWWLIAISGGTRGTWLGMGVAGVVMWVAGQPGRRWLTWQLPAAATGLLFFWLIFAVLTDYLGIEVRNFAGARLTTTLSARDVLWQQAWDMIRERPWLGFGPMHFADIHNPIAAHPHQAILQWASEWGVPSTLLVMWLVGRGLWATFRLIRERADSSDPVDLLRVCLFASLIGALTQSMVDGVIVMPYSQLWLSLVVGWLMGIHVWKGEPAKPHAFIHWSWMGISTAAVLFLVYVVIRDVPHLDERNRLYQEQYGGHFQPRFWTQGVIAIKPR
nr:O-antigen ligase family protein [Pseudomonas gingeri]